MLLSGLVSVTFRQLEAEKIVTLVQKAGLEGIEWGGDIHVPHGDTVRAQEVRKMTEQAGLRVAAYGSYYRAGAQNSVPFEGVLETAVSLNAPTIRVWAGETSPVDTDAAGRHAIANDIRIIAALAEKESITISLEYHEDTLTETHQSAYALLKEIGHANVRSYFQQHTGEDLKTRLKGLDTLTPWLSNVHVFNWSDGRKTELSEGFNEWRSYMDVIRQLQGERFVMLEFVKGNDPEVFFRDAQVLKRLLT